MLLVILTVAIETKLSIDTENLFHLSVQKDKTTNEGCRWLKRLLVCFLKKRSRAIYDYSANTEKTVFEASSSRSSWSQKLKRLADNFLLAHAARVCYSL